MPSSFVGFCRLCGEYKNLSFEHVPPQSAFNNHQRLLQTMQDKIEERPYSRFRRGLGKHTLCESCNNLTGGWYGEAFVSWTKQGFEWFDKVKGEQMLSLPYYIKPLNVLKQSLVMALAMSPESSLKYHRELRRFVLSPRQKYLPPQYRVHVYFNMDGQPRFASGMAVMKVGEGGGANYIEAEVSLPPFGYSITSPVGDYKSLADAADLYEITWFSRYNYDEWAVVHLRIPSRETHQPFPLDYRSRDEIEEHRRNMSS